MKQHRWKCGSHETQAQSQLSQEAVTADTFLQPQKHGQRTVPKGEVCWAEIKLDGSSGSVTGNQGKDTATYSAQKNKKDVRKGTGVWFSHSSFYIISKAHVSVHENRPAGFKEPDKNWEAESTPAFVLMAKVRLKKNYPKQIKEFLPKETMKHKATIGCVSSVKWEYSIKSKSNRSSLRTP